MYPRKLMIEQEKANHTVHTSKSKSRHPPRHSYPQAIDTMASAASRFVLVFHAPTSALQACKSAIFTAGAGRYLDYSECCWTATGTGQFRPGDAANPHVGNVGALEQVEEARVEAMCGGEDVTRKAVEALKR